MLKKVQFLRDINKTIVFTYCLCGCEFYFYLCNKFKSFCLSYRKNNKFTYSYFSLCVDDGLSKLLLPEASIMMFELIPNLNLSADKTTFNPRDTIFMSIVP